jgi:hypothetical protein
MAGWRNYLQGASWRILSKGKGSFPSCVMKDYASMDELLAVALVVEKFLVELGETPYELLKEE